VSTGRSAEDTEASMREAIEQHIEALGADGQPVPQPSARAA